MAKEIISGIYKIENTINRKSYVGSSNNIMRRWSFHKWGLTNGKHHSQKMQRAWDKYGELVFEFCVLELVVSNDDLLTYEQKWLDSLQPAYNILNIAGGNGRRPCSEETKRKISAANKGRIKSDESIQKHAAALRGRPLSEDHKRKLSALRKGRIFSEDHLRKIIAANTGKKRSPEVLEKMAAVSRGKKQSQETIAKRLATRAKNKLLRSQTI